METAKKKGKEKVRSKGETTKADKKRTPEKASKRKHEESVEEPPRKKKSGVETTPVKAHPKSDDEKAKKKKSKKKKKEKEKAHKQSSSSVKQEPEGNKKPTPPPTTPASPPKTPTIKDVEVKHTKDSKKEKKAKKNKKEKKRKGEKENPAKPESNESNLEVKTNSPKKRKSSKLDAPDAEKLKTKDLPPSTPAALAKSAAAKPQRKPKISDTQTAPSDKKVPPQPQATQQQSIASKSAGARKAVAIPIPAAATISQPAKATKKAAPIAVPTTKNGSKKRHPLTPAIIPDDSDEEFTPELLDDNKAKAKPPKKMKLPAMCGGTEFLAETQEEAAQRIQEYEEFRRKRQEVVGSTGKIEFNADGVSLIQEKWADSKVFQQLEASGYAVRKGKFSKEEDEVITKAVENYLAERNEGVELIHRVLFGSKSEKSRDESKLLCQEVGKVVPDRPLNAIYLRLRRKYHPDNYGGPFTPEQEAKLHQLVLMYGRDWKKIGPLIGREPSSCRDRWRFYKMEPCKTGAWSAEENEKLKTIIYSMTVDIGRSAERDIPWEVVATKMGDRSGRQCRIHWYTSLDMQLKGLPSEEEGLTNTQEFLKRVYESGARSESEIQWRNLIDDQWSPWNPCFMEQTWRRLKSLIPNVESMSFDQVLHYLMRQNEKHLQQLSMPADGAPTTPSS